MAESIRFSHKVLRDSRLVRDAQAAESELAAWVDGDGIGICGSRSERYAVDRYKVRGSSGNRDIGGVRKTEGRNIRWTVGNPVWRPVGSRLPVARDRGPDPIGC